MTTVATASSSDAHMHSASPTESSSVSQHMTSTRRQVENRNGSAECYARIVRQCVWLTAEFPVRKRIMHAPSLMRWKAAISCDFGVQPVSRVLAAGFMTQLEFCRWIGAYLRRRKKTAANMAAGRV